MPFANLVDSRPHRPSSFPRSFSWICNTVTCIYLSRSSVHSLSFIITSHSRPDFSHHTMTQPCVHSGHSGNPRFTAHQGESPTRTQAFIQDSPGVATRERVWTYNQRPNYWKADFIFQKQVPSLSTPIQIFLIHTMPIPSTLRRPLMFNIYIERYFRFIGFVTRSSQIPSHLRGSKGASKFRKSVALDQAALRDHEIRVPLDV